MNGTELGKHTKTNGNACDAPDKIENAESKQRMTKQRMKDEVESLKAPIPSFILHRCGSCRQILAVHPNRAEPWVRSVVWRGFLEPIVLLICPAIPDFS